MCNMMMQKDDKSVSYGDLVDYMERFHCDTVGAMLKILKKRKVVSYQQIFLMYPMHKEEMIKLECEDARKWGKMLKNEPLKGYFPETLADDEVKAAVKAFVKGKEPDEE